MQIKVWGRLGGCPFWDGSLNGGADSKAKSTHKIIEHESKTKPRTKSPTVRSSLQTLWKKIPLNEIVRPCQPDLYLNLDPMRMNPCLSSRCLTGPRSLKKAWCSTAHFQRCLQHLLVSKRKTKLCCCSWPWVEMGVGLVARVEVGAAPKVKQIPVLIIFSQCCLLQCVHVHSSERRKTYVNKFMYSYLVTDLDCTALTRKRSARICASCVWSMHGRLWEYDQIRNFLTLGAAVFPEMTDLWRIWHPKPSAEKCTLP